MQLVKMKQGRSSYSNEEELQLAGAMTSSKILPSLYDDFFALAHLKTAITAR
jgi:hypothetical protein